jgi:hypothetical protein
MRCAAAILLLVCTSVIMTGCSKKGGDDRWSPAPAPAPTSSAASVSAPAGAADRGKYEGKWGRTDGDYMLDVQGVSNAVPTVKYFNPNPIHVGKSDWRQRQGGENLFVELQDVNYPGSTYTLRHNAADDTLQGSYYQATQQQTYEVVFERVKE